MEAAEKRSLKEVITLYTLHPEFRDVYVEGITDRLVVDRFLSKNKIKNFQVLEIDDIDFSEQYSANPSLRRNNKKKIVSLSEELEKEFLSNLKGVSCIADKDFDDLTGEIINNSYLIYTDFSCFDMYLFNVNVVRIFYKTVLRTFPIRPQKTLAELGKVLTEKYFIRLALKEKGSIKDEATITDLKKSVDIDKKTGVIRFDSKIHLKKVLHNNNLQKNVDDYLECIEAHKGKSSNEVRNCIRGHDFIHLFYIYINKIKNDIKLSEEMLERSLFQCIDYSELAKEPLFVKLVSKYS